MVDSVVVHRSALPLRDPGPQRAVSHAVLPGSVAAAVKAAPP